MLHSLGSPHWYRRGNPPPVGKLPAARGIVASQMPLRGVWLCIGDPAD